MINVKYSGLDFTLCLICFVIFFIPISYSGFGVNYSFVFFPLIYFLFKKSLYRPSKFIIQLVFFYFLVFSLSAILYVNLFPRRLVSFVIFISLFFFTLVKIGNNEVLGFKVAIVLISCYLSIESILLLVSSGIDLGFSAKSVVGSQRIGFLYIVSFFLILVNFRKINISFLVKACIILLMLIGILLTYNRSSIISFVLVLIMYIMFDNSEYKFNNKLLNTLLVPFFGVLTYYIFVYYFGSGVFDFFLLRLSPEYINATSLDGTSSGAIRLEIWKSIFEYVKGNPILGSGFLGPWILTTVPENSAHSQYFDILFRTGISGFILWFFLTIKITIKLYKIDRALYYGFLSILIFGCFNETFKLSYGAFIYAFCLAYTFQYTNRNKLNY